MAFYSYGEIEKNLQEILQDSLVETEYKDRKGRLWASDSGMCERRGVLSSTFKGDKTYDSTKPFYTQSGIGTESIVLKGLENSGNLLFSNYRLPDIGYNLGGYVDGIIHYKGKIYVLEIKEIGTLPKKAKEMHKAQAMVYSAVLGLPSIILYVQRSIADWKKKLVITEFENSSLIDDIAPYLETVIKSRLYVDKGLIPPKPERLLKTHCKFCDYYDKCWNGDTNFENWENQSLTHSRIHDIVDINTEAQEITANLMQSVILKNRTKGVLKHISLHGNENAKHILVNQSWDNFYNVR